MAEATLSSVAIEKARTELFEDPCTRSDQIVQLRAAITEWNPPTDPNEQDLQFTRQDDDKFLLRFLRAKKFDIERSCLLYVNYHKYRSKYSHLLGDMTVESAHDILCSGSICVLPPREGPRVILVRAGFIDFETVVPGELIKAMLLVFDKVLETDEGAQIHGIMAIEDLTGFSLWSAMKLSGNEALRKGVFVELIQDSFPARFKGVHLVNQPWYFSLVFSLIRPFLKQKLKERFQIHGNDIESLMCYVPAEDLPSDYGGSLEQAKNYTADKLFQQ